jgi:multidrug efflux pump subunit AcrA (membrane-fusion protein)
VRKAQQTSEHELVDLPSYHDDRAVFAEASPTRPTISWWKRRRWMVGIPAILLIIVIAGVIFTMLSSSQPGTNYQYQQVTQGNLFLTAIATGFVQGNVYNVDFTATGTIAEINVSLGQHVRAGQVLASLETTGPQQPALLTAPHAGMVTAINGSIGTSTSTIGNSFTATSTGNNALSFIQIVDVSSLQLLINVNEADLGHVAAGNAVSFTVDAYRTRTFQGTVNTILPMQQTISSVVTYPVIVDIDKTSLQGANLLPGMTVNVTITTVVRSHVPLIPVSAVSFAQKAVVTGLITRDQAQNALASARQMSSDLLRRRGPGAWQDDPNPTYVLERVNDQWVVKPVVLGVTEGTSYEVLAGLSTHDSIVSGEQRGSSTSRTSSPASGQSAAGKG